MSESVVGLTVAATRQNAGRLWYEAGIGSVGGLAGVIAPAATELAMVIVVFGSFRAAILSQVAAEAGVGPIRRAKRIANAIARWILMTANMSGLHFPLNRLFRLGSTFQLLSIFNF